MISKFVIIVLCCISFFVHSQDFKVGSGSEYIFTAQNTKSDLSIYISNSSFSQLGVEYYFSNHSALVPLDMWQQYQFKMKGNSPLEVIDGKILTSKFSKPQKMTNDVFSLNKGVGVDQFLFSDKSDIEKFKVGQGVIEVPAGKVQATHYRKKRDGQVVDFWISDQVKPIGLVKLISKSSQNPKQNYAIELKSLLVNVKPKISN